MPQSVYNSCPNCLEHTFPVFPLYDQIHLILQILAKISCSKRAFYHLKQFGLWFLPTAPNLLSIVFTMSLLLCLIFVCMPLKYKLIEVRDLVCLILFFFFALKLFTYPGLCWVFVSVWASPVAINGGYSLVAWVSHCSGSSCGKAQALGTRASVIVAHELSCSKTCGDQTHFPCIDRQIAFHCTTREVLFFFIFSGLTALCT